MIARGSLLAQRIFGVGGEKKENCFESPLQYNTERGVLIEYATWLTEEVTTHWHSQEDKYLKKNNGKRKSET